MAIGDSHTFATGVSPSQTWPNVLEDWAFEDPEASGTIYNMGVIGYSLGQYLVRLRENIDLLKPQLVLIGFSMATDLYDVIPPSEGGFIYGEKFGRVYFELDEGFNLIEKEDLVGKRIKRSSEENSEGINYLDQIKGFLGQFKIFEKLKRSFPGYLLSAYFRPGGYSLIPGLDTALKINLNERDRYRWKLAEKLISKIAEVSKEHGAAPVLVNIPYVPQVYDEVWKVSFGLAPDQYDRWIASERMRKICSDHGVYFIDVTPEMIQYAKKNRKWLHFRVDGHPTVQGHQFIAKVILKGLKEVGLLGLK